MANLGLLFTLISVGLQMCNVDGGFLTSYLADIAGPVWLYGSIRTGNTLLKYVLPKLKSPLAVALFVFSIGTVWEICQAIDFRGTILNITRGRFDPFDIAAFAISLTGCYWVDKHFEKIHHTISLILSMT